MRKIFRIIIAIVVLFGIVGLAQSQVAWAANSSEKSNPSALQLIEKPGLPDKWDDCDKPWNKHKDECKDKHKDKDKCKYHRKDCRSVKPPPPQIFIPVTGEYSVGGYCTLSVTLNDPVIQLDARIKIPLPGKFPEKVYKTYQGCLLTYSSSRQRINELPADSGSTTICFAAIPGKTMTLYFYNIYAPHAEWVALETTTQAGKACASGNASGVYAATSQRP